MLAAGPAVDPAAAQFGQNKVQYRSFDWRVLETEHFRIYFYAQERPAAQEAARMAERGYEYLSDFFQHEFADRIPVILYSSHQDFEQSNVIGGFIGEGTGGVTESLKGRVTLPLTGSYAELNHVLVHELVHAFQFDMLKRNFLGQIGIGPLPLWMMEGMAEWVSNGIDPITAMWVMDAHREDKVPSVQDMATIQDIRVYRLGQALYEVIGQNFGPERVRRMLKRPSRRRGLRPGSPDSPDSTFTPQPPPTATQTATTANVTQAFGAGTVERQSLEQLWRAYAESLGTALSAGLVSPDSVAEVVAKGKGYGRSFHLAPVASSDGSKVLFYSARSFHNELFVAERTENGWKKRDLVTGEQTPDLEGLPLLSASADWSPDGRHVVFVATRQGKDILQILDFKRRKIVRTVETELLAISNPSYSPDGRWVIFSALLGGEEDLFVVEIESGRLVRLTQDAYAERTARFSPGGDAVIFATDRGPETDVDDLIFGPWNIARMQLRSVDGDIVSGSVVQIIDSPANEFSPVWSPDGAAIAFISDRSGTYQVHTYELATGEVRQRTRFASGVIGIIPTGPAVSWAPSGEVFYSVFQAGGWHLYRTEGFPEDLPGEPDEAHMQLTRSHPEDIHEEADHRVGAHEKEYHARLTPEYAVVGALYIGNAGAAGSGQLLLGDMLGNQYLLIAGNLRSNFDESEFLVQYANIGGRWQWGIAGYQFREDYLVITADDQANFQSTVRRGIGAQLYYPFNRFRRIEFLLDLTTVDEETADFLFVGSDAFVTDDSRNRFYYVIPGMALVQDNTSYSGFTPIAGGRWRAEVSRAIGDIDYTFGILDWRRYYNVKRRGALAVRLLSAASWGEDQQLLRIGGPNSFRGGDFGELEGTRVAFANIEARFPIFPSTELIRGVVFVDLATAWDEHRAIENQKVQSAYGFGLRGFIGLPLRFDAAIPNNNDESWQTFFSIGFDY
ncbi:MAG: BamA/TamA family outer membrane protein [Candidatus Krumholzibacteriia bacterium]